MTATIARPTRVDTGTWGDDPIRVVPETASHALNRALSASRPWPSDELAEDQPERFVPDQAFEEWIRGTFIEADGPLANEAHQHLLDAKLGVLWTNAINVRQLRHILATAEIPQTMGGRWKQGRMEQQTRDWFRMDVDFLLTFYAPAAEQLDNRAFCALVEHELHHCGQAIDGYGQPKFSREDGRPIFAIKGHDVEEFVDVVARYGMTSPDVKAIVDAALKHPAIGDGPLDLACGTCLAGVR